jgi:pimeloyl-ACP methyl ester carboxylesterase
MEELRSLRCVELGHGAPALVLHAFGVRPDAYLPLARKLAERVRIVIPDLFALTTWWEQWCTQRALDCLAVTLDDLNIERATVIGHSFGGGVAIGLASHHPDRVEECVFVDTLGSKRQLSLAREAARPIGLLRTASRPAAISFLRSWAAHPVQLASAAVDTYRSKRGSDIDALSRAAVRCHVLWAADDEILSPKDGEDFARRLNASFTLAAQPPGDAPLTHDWIIDRPEVFVTHLDKLGLRILGQFPR